MSADQKRVATLQARAALIGTVLRTTTDDYERPLYIASRDELCKAFHALDDVETWLDRLARQRGGAR